MFQVTAKKADLHPSQSNTKKDCNATLLAKDRERRIEQQQRCDEIKEEKLKKKNCSNVNNLKRESNREKKQKK